MTDYQPPRLPRREFLQCRKLDFEEELQEAFEQTTPDRELIDDLVKQIEEIGEELQYLEDHPDEERMPRAQPPQFTSTSFSFPVGVGGGSPTNLFGGANATNPSLAFLDALIQAAQNSQNTQDNQNNNDQDNAEDGDGDTGHGGPEGPPAPMSPLQLFAQAIQLGNQPPGDGDEDSDASDAPADANDPAVPAVPGAGAGEELSQQERRRLGIMFLQSLMGSNSGMDFFMNSMALGGQNVNELEQFLESQEPVPLKAEQLAMIPSQEYLTTMKFDSCSICLDKLKGKTEEDEKVDQVRVLPCTHIYHTDCIDQWFKENVACPVCKKDQRDLLAATTKAEEEETVPASEVSQKPQESVVEPMS